MLNNEKIHYVYGHFHPETDECVYIGHGKHERAWRCSFSGNSRLYGHRSEEHSNWLSKLELEGYAPSDWVEILDKGLSKEDACISEQKFIEMRKPVFNRPQGTIPLFSDKHLLEDALSLKNSGLSYENVAKKLKTSTMTVYRALTGKTKNING